MLFSKVKKSIALENQEQETKSQVDHKKDAG